MTKKEYAELLKAILRTLAEPIEEYLETNDRDFCENYDFNEGIVYGLTMAIAKIDQSMFLCEGSDRRDEEIPY